MKRIGIAAWVFCILPSLPALALESDYKPYIECVEEQESEDADSCLDRAGGGERRPVKSFYGCMVNKQLLEFSDQNNLKLSWEVLFMNEHCRTIDEPFYKRANQRDQ